MLKYSQKALNRASRAKLQEMFEESGIEFNDSLTNAQLREILSKVEVEETPKEETTTTSPEPQEPSEEFSKEETQDTDESVEKEDSQDNSETLSPEPQEDSQETSPEPQEEPSNEEEENQNLLVRNMMAMRRAKYADNNQPSSVSQEIRKRRTGKPEGLSLKEIIAQRRLNR